MFQPISREEYHKIKWPWMYKEHNCPFCDVESNISHIIWRGKYWYILHNISSYSWDHRHIMAVPYKHIKLSTQLKKYHFKELKEVHKVVKDFFKKDNYFSFTRESLTDDTRSVEHLHIHFLVWKMRGKFLRKMLEIQGYPIKQDLEIN